jgi:ribosomal protein S10
MLKNQNLNNNIYIHIKSFIFSYLFKDIKHIFLELIKSSSINSIINSNLYLPKRVKKFSVVRSPTMSKLSKEQFEIKFYKVCLMFKFKYYLDYVLLKNYIYKINLKYSYFKFTSVQLYGLECC